jgi:enoyl-CoA hydratase
VARLRVNSWHDNQQCKRVLQQTEGMSLKAGLAHEFFRHPRPAPDMTQRIAAFNHRKS